MLDTASGLYYQFSRYMDPELGRWLSLDPRLGSIGSPQTLNRYVYCVNNPLRFVDPWGMSSDDFGVEGLESDVPYGSIGWSSDWEDWVDDVMLDVGFIPVVDTLSDIWFIYRAYESGNSAELGLNIGLALIPGASCAYYRAAKTGMRNLPDVARHADDMPTVRNSDDIFDVVRANRGGRTTVMAGDDIPIYRVYGDKSKIFRPSWTAVNPLEMSQLVYRRLAGLPSGNTAEFMARGYIPRGTVFDVRASLPFNDPMFGRLPGGLPEVLIDPSAVRILVPGIPIFS